VIGVHRPGAYAEYAVAPAENALILPDDVSAVNAAVLLANGPIALAQIEAAAIGEGDVLIVPGVTGSLGSMIAALASRRGIRVVGVTRDAERAREMPLSCDVIVDAAVADLEAELRQASGGSGAHAVIDNICISPTWEACLSALRMRGRVVISGAMGAAPVTFDPRPFYLANRSIIGIRTANRSNIQAFWREVTHGLRPDLGPVDEFPLKSAPEAHRLVEEGHKTRHYVLLAGESGLSD
jgi:NADPH:quinone reductase-like Zn-dependent oxidoreductase